MTTHQMACDSCGRATPNGVVLCHDCLTKLEQILAETPALVRDLELVFRRQTRYTDRVGSRSSVTPLPYDSRAADMLRSLHHELAMAVRWITEPRGMDWPTDNRGVYVNKTSGLACWLLAHIGSVRVDVAGGDIHRSLTELWTRAQRLIDAPPERWYAGPCRACQADLWATSRSGMVECGQCGTKHDIAQRREQLLNEARDRLAIAAEIARVACYLGGDRRTEDQVEALLRQWVKRSRIGPHGRVMIDGQWHATYRVGDVLDLLANSARRIA